jgi:hemoglobin/transferrin/lactoferrin receptor protein
MRKIWYMLCMYIPITVAAQEQQDTLTNKEDLSEIIVYANKFAEKRKNIAQSITVIKNPVSLNMQPNTADVLINTGSLFVQKSQQGGGSPVIRGFEASRILLMVDGVRLNNAIFRAGHLQNIISVDNTVLSRIEILYGPSSTMYGSDALGGVINMHTRNPTLNKSKAITGSALARYSSAINEGTGHVDFNIAGKQWASFTSITYRSFGDVIQGNNRRDAYPNFGKKMFIVRRVGNTDSAFVNPDPNKQVSSGYNQVDVLQKILFQPNANNSHLLNIQLSNSTDIPRYDRLTEVASGAPAFAEWYYGPQKRNMIAYRYNGNNMKGFFREMIIGASYQDLEESRITRRFKNNNKDYRWERVQVFGFTADAKHYAGNHELQIGAESYTNFVRSTAERKNVITNALSRIQTRYADGPVSMSSSAVYAQHTLKIGKHFVLNEGLRFNLINMDAKFADTSIMRLPFVRAKQQNAAVTGNIGIVYNGDKQLKIALLLSSGFRAPNVDDLSKVFETVVGRVIVPNNDIKPEYTYNAELNVFKEAGIFSFGASVFYTRFTNAIVVDRFKLNGQDSIVYNNVKSAVFANQNKAKAYIYGFSTQLGVAFTAKTKLQTVVTYTYGRYTDFNGASIPLDHVPPVYGRVGLSHTEKKWNAEAWMLFNGWKRLSNYNLNGEDNLQYATADGMPAWQTLNLQAGCLLGKHVQLQVLAENLLDINYRYFASGISAPGRNFSISIKTFF